MKALFFRLLRWSLIVLVVLAVAMAIFVRFRMHGPYRDYRVDIAFISENNATPDVERLIQAGVAKRDITPDLSRYDGWTDADGNSKFEPEKGDTYEDRNANGDFDFVWLAGFDSNRPAQGVNDPLWSRAIALRHGGRTVVLVTIDSIGLTHERFIRIRKEIDHHAHGIDHIVFSCTHTHNSPDTMGIWSYHRLPWRFDERYLDLVVSATKEAVLEAVRRLEPVEISYAKIDVSPESFVRDSRLPEVYDRQLGVIHFQRRALDESSRETLATLVSWGNHPEAMGSKNPLVSSDFVHYWRDGVENGVGDPGGRPGLGGLCLYFQGPVGGLMTPLGLTVPDKDGHTKHSENGIGKTKALGENLALLTLKVLAEGQTQPLKEHRLALRARTVFVPIEGTYKYPVMLGLIHPGWYDGKAKTEVSALRLGEIEILTVPGEIYPEIVDGGIETPEGNDFALGAPREVPPLREEMGGALNLVVNLANDEVGYIIPKSQWDAEPPFTYGRDSAPYGEVTSGGPNLGVVLHGESLAVLRDLHGLLDAPETSR